MRYIIIGLIIISSLSCSKEENKDFTFQIGEDFVGTTTKAYFIDTLTVKATTFQFDSLVVSDANRLLIGAYNDPVFGKISSKSFVQLRNTVYDIEVDAVYDSIALILIPDRYFYNDTIPIQQFKVFNVLDDIEPDEEDYNYYNTANFNYDIVPIGIKDFYATPNKSDSLDIKINDDYGLTLFNKLKDNDINNSDDFLDDYKGVLIAANNDTNTTVLGFSANSFIRLYYTVDDNDDESEEKKIDFTFNLSNTFNQISSDKTGTYFENIVDQETLLPSTETDNSFFIQAGTGIVTRFDIPHLKTLNDISFQGVVVDAKLKFSLKEHMYSDNLYTRDSIQVYIIDNKSNVLTNLNYDDTTPIMSSIEDHNPEFDTDVYVIDIKSFIDIKQSETYEEYFLAIYPQNFNNSVDRYIFNGNGAPDDLQIKLELTYATYE
ncbi:DUF4270 family protein [Psychroflexus sp. MES1-P1E]|uniref:DUF4270 family protein n=1 Tax=Psychroflexus sp. MES1-P1E TaxID=2058320 RepID=UPI000C7B46A5|nr:DUF4270 family protein [Psychroflexus sp. MES1-P1E]PKG43765.1 hypothetical protein CXF67_03240 [Psychroflexus sp. MES1-P1E]